MVSSHFWPLHCLSFDSQLLITLLVSCGHCIDCPLIYVFWLPYWYLVAIALSVLWFTASDYPIGIVWPLYWLSFDSQLLITLLVSCGHCIDCPLIYVFWLPYWYLHTFGHSIECPLIYSFWLPYWYLHTFGHCIDCLLIYVFWLPYWYLHTFGHCIVCPLIHSFWLPYWYLVAIVLTVLWFTSSDYPIGILWPLHCLTFDLRLLITLLVSSHF